MAISTAQSIIQLALKNKPENREGLNAIKRLVLRTAETRNLLNATQLLQAYHKLLTQHKIKKSVQLEKLLTKRSVRTLSGVAIVTVLTKPYPCPGQCIYCPTESRMPKSYLSDEPAAARALALKFDPYEQVRRRLQTLTDNGHPTDKIELIIKGGTWNAYPLAYQYWFILRCFKAANVKSQNAQAKTRSHDIKFPIEQIEKLLAQEELKNEHAKHRIIGLTLETRPDFINETTIGQMREQGCTRVELGVQHTSDKILKLIRRGHDSASVRTASALLKNYGFKVDYHLMPQLPGSTPASDLKMMLEIFHDPAYRPDMIKIYPCTVIKNSSLYSWLKRGKYRPYSDKKLIATLIKFKTALPRYARISRLIRDIPAHHIQAGNRVTNLRQIIQSEMKRLGLRCHCLRCREAGHNQNLKLKTADLRLFTEKYQASGGTEYFFSYEDKQRQIVYAFCRLRLNFMTPKPTPFFSAIIRELHTYGQMLDLGVRNKQASQHQGLGRKLVQVAENIAKKHGYKKLAVISGVGVREYYRRLGYKKQQTYMVKSI